MILVLIFGFFLFWDEIYYSSVLRKQDSYKKRSEKFVIRNSTELPDSGDYVDGESGFITTTEFGMRSTTREESTKSNDRPSATPLYDLGKQIRPTARWIYLFASTFLMLIES